MIKRMLAMVLVLAMVLSLMPTVVLAEGTEVVKSPRSGQHTDAGHADDCGLTSGWQAWGDDPGETGLPTSGNWYLTKDIHVTGGVNTTGDLNLCLNGFVIYKTGTGRIYGTQNGSANTMTICDCTAYEDNGVYYAGALTGGLMTSQDGGGAVFVRRQGVLKVYDGRFVNNIYKHDTEITGGGAIMLQGVSSGKFATVQIYGGEFAENKAYKANGTTGNSGGAIGSGGGAVIEISGGTFRNNFGGEGGAISLGDTNKLTITGGKFINNSGKDGGVIYGAASTVSISGATFTGNTATSSGSVIHNNGAMTLTIGDGTVITGNTGTNTNGAEGYSAAVSMCGSDGKLTLSGKVIIADNTTGAAGVASLNFNKAASDTLYVNELAEGSYVEFSTPKTVPVAAGDVIALNGTQTKWNNGWVAHMGTDGQLQYIGYEASVFKFADAHVHTLCGDTGCTEHTARVAFQPWGDDESEKGKLPASGNWYLVDNVTVTSEVKIDTATTLNLCLNGKTVTGFSGSNGRAYSTTADVATTINICDCSAKTENGVYQAGKFTGFTNTSTGSGGAVIFIRQGSALNIFDGMITDSITRTGGTVYIKYSTFTMWNGEISGNKALNGTSALDGGGVYLDNSVMTMHGGKISGNETADQGGGIYMAASALTMTGGSIENNSGKWGGGISFSSGTSSLDMRGGSITGNTATSNGGGIQAAYAAAVIKLSGDAVITGNKLESGADNNIRLGNSGTVTVGSMVSGAKIGITAGAGRVFSANATSSDLSGYFSSDDASQVVFWNADKKLQLKDAPAAPPAADHKHTLCNDTGCAEHTGEVVYQPWESATSLPTEGNWYLTKDVTVTQEVQLSQAENLNLCLNGKTVTGGTGKNLRAYSTTANVATVINISDCTAKTEAGEYKAGKFTGFVNTHTNSGGGCFFIRTGGQLNIFDGIIENCVSASGGAAICLNGATATMYDGRIRNNKAIYNGEDYHGGAVFMYNNAVMTVYGGEISGNEADMGGAFYLAKSSLIMRGGRITGNKANWGAAVNFADGNCSVDLRDCAITGNTATSNGGGIQGAYGAATIKLSGDVNISANKLEDGTANNLRLGGSASMTVENLGANALVGITATAGRSISNAVASDVSAQFPSDDADYITFLNSDSKLELKSSFVHVHCECGKDGCTDASHRQISYLPWKDAASLPDDGNYCLTTDVTISKEASVAGTLNLCLNGHKVTGGTGRGLRFFSTPGTGGEVLTITDCGAKWDNGVYTAGGFYDNTNTHTASGGGAIFIRKGGHLNFYEGIVSGNASATGGAAFYVKDATANFFGGLVENNKATYEGKWYNGGAIYNDNAVATVIYGTVFTGNEAGYGGAIHNGGSSHVEIRGGKITGNIAHTNGGGINATSVNASVELSGDVVIIGNKQASGKANNLRLGGTGVMDVEELGENAQIGVTADVFRAISTKTKDYAKNFISDNAKLQVIYQNEVLYMSASGDHKHCNCVGAAATGCQHEKLTFVEWDDPTGLPTSGNYYLGVDVVVSAQHRLENATLNLCLNGHTVKVGDQGGRAYYMTSGAKLNISDCEAAGKITGATAAAILTNSAGKDMELNLFGGTITDNHAKSSGGAVVVQGECTFNMYGGAITGNSVTSYLKTDAEGKVILDASGNQTYYNANGGALYVANGVFNMYGGEISGNVAKPVEYLKAGAKSATVSGGVGGAMQITNAATANLYGGKICGNTADNGGGVFVVGADTVLNLLGTEISGNTAKNGGGVISQTHATSYMKAGKITGNIATVSGAGFYVSTGTTLYMQGGEICQNEAIDGTTAKNGGGLYILSSTVEFTGGKVWGNKAASGAGMYSSAVMSGDKPRNAVIYIKDGALITDNHASLNGGAIMMSGRGEMTTGEGSMIIMTGGEISKNTAKNAGGILTQTKSAMELSGGKITGNKANDGGGGIYISTGTKLTMTGGTITGNTAKSGGGGLFLLRSTGIFKGGSISNNTAGSGGGIKNNGAKMDIYNLSVVGNDAVGTTAASGKYTAGNAGGLWAGRAGYKKNGVQMYDTPVINIYNIYLADSTATGPAGGILIQSQGTVFNMYGGTITGNATEDSSGGGLYLSSNVTANITGGTFTKNLATNGSAIYIGNNNAKISGIKVYENHALNSATITVTGKTTTDAVLKNAELYNNVADGHVGVLVIQGYANLTLEDSKIYGNHAAGIGGAIYFSNPGYGTLKNVEIYENESEKGAGGVFVGQNSIVKMDNVTIRDNVAGIDYGGGVYNRGRLVIVNSKILNNTIKNGSGGGIGSFKTSSTLLADDAGVFVENTVISGNKANLQGGAVYGHRGCPVYLTDCTITDNTSAMEGGAVYADGRLGMQNVTVTGNVSGGEGFAVYLTPSEFDGHSYQTGHKRMGGNMIIKDNKGGDLYLSEGTVVAVTGESLGEKSHVNVTLHSGVVTQWVQGVYNYEGGDGEYVLTAGNRSITDPEPIPAAQEQAGENGEKTASGDVILYVGIGVFVIALAAVAAVLLTKKKKAGKPAEEVSKE